MTSSALEVIELLPTALTADRPRGELADLVDDFNAAWNALDAAADRLRVLVATGGNPQLATAVADQAPPIALLDRIHGRRVA